jgi:hypothetical protein
VTAPLDYLLKALRTFWFRPEPVYTLGLIRIAFGALIVAWTLSFPLDLSDLFGINGVAPEPPRNPYVWTIFRIWPGGQALLIGWLVLLLSALAMTVGWHSRLASIAVCILILSFQHRNPSVFNAGDVLIRIEALFLALAPSGAALSLDQRRLAGVFWSAQVRAPWAIRFMQVQLSVLYLASVRWKLSGTAWPEGTAVSYALRLQDMLVVPAPKWFIDNPMFVNVATWGALAVELSLGVLVWNNRVRPWVLLAGVGMHVSIMLTMGVGFFAPAVFVLYLAFVPPERVRGLPGRLRSRLGATPRVTPRTESTNTPASTSAEPTLRPATPATTPVPSTPGWSSNAAIPPTRKVAGTAEATT